MRAFNEFVGIPWVQGGCSEVGADCWGLLTLVSREVYGVVIAEYEGSKVSGELLTTVINYEMANNRWRETYNPRPGDAVVMFDRVSGKALHVGIFVENGNILHSPDQRENGTGSSAIHPVRVLNRVFKRLEYYRYDHDIK